MAVPRRLAVTRLPVKAARLIRAATPIAETEQKEPRARHATDRMTEHRPLSPATAREVASRPDLQTVTSVTHWTDRLFSFRITRPSTFRFRSGEFVMIGMTIADPDTGREKPLLRAYSIASPSWDDALEFYSIKVADGPLTSRLQHIAPGDGVILRPKPVGTLVHDALLPGRRLWLFATGTGIAPFASLLREPQTYGYYDEVILTHTCRETAELAYGAALIDTIRSDDLLSELIGADFHRKLRYYPTTTRDRSARTGRITDLMRNGTLYSDLDVPPLDPERDRAMICGNLAFNLELKALLEQRGLAEGANSAPGHFVVEKAFLD